MKLQEFRSNTVAVRVPLDAHEDTDNAIKLLLKIMQYGGDYSGKYKEGFIGISCDIDVSPYKRISFCILNRFKTIVLIETVKFNVNTIESGLQDCFNLLARFKTKADNNEIAGI